MPPSHKPTPTPTPKKAALKKLDPARATVYVAIIAVIGTIMTTALSKISASGGANHTTSHADEIVPVKEDRYDQIIAALDELAQALDEAKDSIANENLSVEEKNRKLQKINRCLEKNRAIKSLLITKHEDYQAALQTSDFAKAKTIQNEMDSVLKPRMVVNNNRSLRLRCCGKLVSSQAFADVERELHISSTKDLLDWSTIATDSAGSPTPAMRSKESDLDDRRKLMMLQKK